MPHTCDVMQNRNKYKYYPKIDWRHDICLFYCFVIDKESKEQTVTTHPGPIAGSYNNWSIAYGLTVQSYNSTKVLFMGIGLLYINNTWKSVQVVFKSMNKQRFKSQPSQSNMSESSKKTNFLGYAIYYIMTPRYYKPMINRIDILLLMKQPKNKKQVSVKLCQWCKLLQDKVAITNSGSRSHNRILWKEHPLGSDQNIFWFWSTVICLEWNGL